MSSVNYSLGKRGVRLIKSEDAWVVKKDGSKRLNPKYSFVGKVEMTMPNMVVNATDKKKPSYKCDVGELPRAAKQQLVEHFYDDRGKRNKRTVAYFGVEKDGKQKSRGVIK